MKITKIYRYIGQNGIITSSVLLNNIDRIDMYYLIADENKYLTNGQRQVRSAEILVEDLEDWTEIEIVVPDNKN